MQEENLYEKIIDEIAELLKARMGNIGVVFSNDVDSIGTLIEYINFQEKQIIPIPRKVIISKELQEKVKNKEFAEETIKLIEHFEDLFKNGKDINGHLSKQIFSGNTQDILYNNWNIKHVHLSERNACSKEEMSGNRGDFLLFCIVLKSTVFFLDVREHPHREGFTAFSFLELICNNNWMKHIGFEEDKNIIDIDPKIENDSDIYKLYKSNYNIIFKLNNKIFCQIDAVRSNGNKSSQVDKSTEISRKLKSICDKYPANTKYEIHFNEKDSTFNLILNKQTFILSILK